MGKSLGQTGQKVHLSLKARLIPCEEGGFTAYCPQIRGAVSQGETEEEALENLADAVEGVLAVNAEMADEHLSSQPFSSGSKEYDLSVA